MMLNSLAFMSSCFACQQEMMEKEVEGLKKSLGEA